MAPDHDSSRTDGPHTTSLRPLVESSGSRVPARAQPRAADLLQSAELLQSADLQVAELRAAAEKARRLEDAVGAAQDLAADAYADNTHRAYASDWADFTEWCRSVDARALPATTETVALYVAARSGELAVSTLRRRMAAINECHRQLGYAGEEPATTKRNPLRRVWKGLLRRDALGERREALTETQQLQNRKAPPIGLHALRRMIEALPREEPGPAGGGDPTNGGGSSGYRESAPWTLLGLRDRALLLVAWAGALRRSEITALRTEDLTTRPEGLLLHLRRSKTDQEGKGHYVGVPFGEHRATCPVRAVQDWTLAAGIERGPVLRSVDRWGNVSGQALSEDGVNRIIKKAAERAGYPKKKYSGHSPRSGFITEAARSGRPDAFVMKHTRHKTHDVYQGYVIAEEAFRDNVVLGLGL